MYFAHIIFRKLLRDGIKIANAQDLNGITAITLLMLGTTFHCEGSDGAIKVSNAARIMQASDWFFIFN